MNLNIILKRSVHLMFAIATLSSLTSCENDEVGNGNGLTPTNLDPIFTVATVSANHYKLTGTTNAIFSKWDLGDGAGFYIGKDTENIFLPDAGDYVVQHQVFGQGGIGSSIATQTISVATSDPNSGNLVQGGKLDTASDISKWTVLNISSSGTSWAFVNGKATVTGGGWNQQGFYQAISVVSGRTYKVDMVASSTSGVSNTWFEVFVSPTIPIQNNDYSAGGKIRSINTWAGCGGSAFSGKISSVGCGGTDNVGTYKATATGTVYLVIKCGGENLKDGISVDNIELRGI